MSNGRNLKNVTFLLLSPPSNLIVKHKAIKNSAKITIGRDLVSELEEEYGIDVGEACIRSVEFYE